MSPAIRRKPARASRPPESYACPCTALRKGARAVSRQYEMALAKAGVSVTQYSILRALQREGSMPLVRLAESLVMERTSLYRTIRPLISQHLVKVQGAVDRRVKEVSLTPAGLRKIHEAFPHWADAQKAFLKLVGAEDWERFSVELNDMTSTVVKAG